MEWSGNVVTIFQPVPEMPLLSLRREVNAPPTAFGHLKKLFTVRVWAGHFGSGLLRSRGKFSMASGADEFYLVAWQFDVLRCRNHELFVALRTLHTGVIRSSSHNIGHSNRSGMVEHGTHFPVRATGNLEPPSFSPRIPHD